MMVVMDRLARNTVRTSQYDPFAAGPLAVEVRTVALQDAVRGRIFPCELWSPAGTDRYPLVVYSHYSGGDRRKATFLCSHLASHGYAVAAMDHSEVVAPELKGREGETEAEREIRIDAIIASRVPDLQFLLARVLAGTLGVDIDGTRIGLAGHSFGGWTVLATPDVEPRVRAIVAMAPGGSSRPMPGVLRLSLSFAWGRDVPTLFLAGEQDAPVPLDDVRELFDRTPASKRMFVLRRADHQHFVDDVEAEHEAVRTMTIPGEAAWIPAAMRPIDEMSSREQAHQFVRSLALAHFDASLRGVEDADRFLDGRAVAELAARGVEAFVVP
jgi:predicted dienelactone hydrolase